jgi:hypothetical protein
VKRETLRVDECKVREPRRELLDRNPCFELAQVGAEAEVDALPEREVPTGVGA